MPTDGENNKRQLYNSLSIGAIPLAGGATSFRVWAPRVKSVAVVLPDSERLPVLLSAAGNGYFSGTVTGIQADECYYYQLDGTLNRPDPASSFQPAGVHGPSQVVDHSTYQWGDKNWCGIPLDRYIIYELHVGTFTDEGTFDGVISKLDYLCELGITAIELMPVAQFPGERNWGYDGTFIYAPQHSYGGPAGLKRLVDACHQKGLAVILDVVYNHLGPEGNYLHAYGPYFTNRYRTPWGDAVNFDGPDSDPVRNYFINNAVHWISEYHIDSLRLDAVHGIYDFSVLHILQELTAVVHQQGAALGRQVFVIAESDLNDVRVVKSTDSGGYGLDAQWNDDFHHALRSLLTGDSDGYYCDFGRFSHLVKGFQEGFIITGEYSSFRRRRHGSSSLEIPPGKLVVFSQNHDQIGNRMLGERLGEHLLPQQLMLAAATVLLSPYLPLLFMGEEYAELAPFPYFVSHGDADLVAAVRKGRLDEFAAFTLQVTPPDPQSESTFLAAKLDHKLRQRGHHQAIFNFYCELIRLRKECAPIANLSRNHMQIVVSEEESVLAITKTESGVQVLCLFNYSDQVSVLGPSLVSSKMTVLLDSTGNCSPGSCVTVNAACPDTFPTLAPFGVIIYRLATQGEL